MHGTYRTEETHAAVQEIARKNAEHRTGMEYEITLTDGAEVVGVVRTGTKCPVEIEVVDPARSRNAEKDIAWYERSTSDDGYYPVERWTLRLISVNIRWADGQEQRFDRAYRVA